MSSDNIMFSDLSHIQKQDSKMALKKYRKALRYLDVCWEKENIDEGELPNCSSYLLLVMNY